MPEIEDEPIPEEALPYVIDHDAAAEHWQKSVQIGDLVSLLVTLRGISVTLYSALRSIEEGDTKKLTNDLSELDKLDDEFSEGLADFAWPAAVRLQRDKS